MELAHPASGVLKLLRDMATADFSGEVADCDLVYELTPDMSGFMVYAGGGLALVQLATSGIEDWQWSIHIVSGLAKEVPRSLELLQWVHERNKAQIFGKHIITMTDDGFAAVMYETMLWGGHFKVILDRAVERELRMFVGSRLRGELAQVIRIGAETSADVLGAFGGTKFEASQEGALALFMCSGN